MKVGVLLSNLGTPEAPTPEALKVYLDEFLMDPWVIDIPWPLRALLIKGIVLRKRPAESAEKYKEVWTEKGSPLLVTSYELEKKLQEKLDPELYSVKTGMRYGNPSIASALEDFKKEGVEEVRFMALYPHYSTACNKSSDLKFLKESKRLKFPRDKQRLLKPFFSNEKYIESIKKLALSEGFKKESYDHVLFSYHGVPVRHLKKMSKDCLKNSCGDCCLKESSENELCYRRHCMETSRLIAESLGLEDAQYSSSFQSRFGKDPWLEPFTDDTLKRLAHEGVKRLAVFCPAFVTDCLETLEEIQGEGQEIFKENGGEAFKQYSCLNASEDWVDLLKEWVESDSVFYWKRDA